MNKQAVIRTALRVGVLAGLVCIAWSVLLYATGQNPFGPKRLMIIFVTPAAGVIAQWQVRKHHRAQATMGWQLLMGIVAVGLTAVLSAVGVYSVARVGGEKLMQRNLAEATQIVEASRKQFSEKELSKAAYEANKRSLPVAAGTAQGVANEDFQKKLLLGLLLTVPGAIFLRR
ncbi:DUF4199 domain-containing protein [Hymenobacter sp. CRA2]|uniref:DUF4199 domain-containing protein n=1 Tax=Hymenobacter sp. CRA2 TaxID=1955620 RepID=UPI00098EA8C1|nr:DUF4199 domain-containing protein [Hymenobacter sp. CRA2]OON68419.1 hypothetical protein B0919_12200 [Hymenobacter sp. CRA2]